MRNPMAGISPPKTLAAAGDGHAGIDDSEQQVEFASSARDALWLAFGAAAFSPGAMYARTATWRWIIGGAVVFVAAVALQRAFWRERLSLDLVRRRYTYSYGYWPRLTNSDGRLDALKEPRQARHRRGQPKAGAGQCLAQARRNTGARHWRPPQPDHNRTVAGRDALAGASRAGGGRRHLSRARR